MAVTVYVVQEHRRYNKETGEYEPVHDLSPAEKFGELKYLLTPTAAPWNPQSIIDELWEGLKDYGEGDYILLVGNPVLCGLVAAVASEIGNGSLRFLQWNGRSHSYIAVEAQVFSVDEDSVRG